MDPEKRKLILAEIERWRRGQLLPEQYCDFLRNLYLEGEAEPASRRWLQLPRRVAGRIAAGWRPAYGWSLLGLISLILSISLYFTVFHPLLQTVLSLLLVTLLIGIGLHKRTRNPLAGFAALGSGCLLALLLGLALLRLHGAAPQASVALVAACGLLWIGAGLAGRIGPLQLAGYVALLLCYLWLIQSWHAAPGFWLLQLYLLPAAALLYGAGSWIYGGIGSAGAMLMFTAGLALLAPEGYLLAFAGAGAVPAVPAMIGKGIAAAILVRRRRAADRDGDMLHDFD